MLVHLLPVNSLAIGYRTIRSALPSSASTHWRTQEWQNGSISSKRTATCPKEAPYIPRVRLVLLAFCVQYYHRAGQSIAAKHWTGNAQISLDHLYSAIWQDISSLDRVKYYCKIRTVSFLFSDCASQLQYIQATKTVHYSLQLKLLG